MKSNERFVFCSECCLGRKNILTLTVCLGNELVGSLLRCDEMIVIMGQRLIRLALKRIGFFSEYCLEDRSHSPLPPKGFIAPEDRVIGGFEFIFKINKEARSSVADISTFSKQRFIPSVFCSDKPLWITRHE